MIPFRFAEIPVRRRRPVVVLSGRCFNQANGASLVAIITSTTATQWPSDPPPADLESVGLQVSCILR